VRRLQASGWGDWAEALGANSSRPVKISVIWRIVA